MPHQDPLKAAKLAAVGVFFLRPTVASDRAGLDRTGATIGIRAPKVRQPQEGAFGPRREERALQVRRERDLKADDATQAEDELEFLCGRAARGTTDHVVDMVAGQNPKQYARHGDEGARQASALLRLRPPAECHAPRGRGRGAPCAGVDDEGDAGTPLGKLEPRLVKHIIPVHPRKRQLGAIARLCSRANEGGDSVDARHVHFLMEASGCRDAAGPRALGPSNFATLLQVNNIAQRGAQVADQGRHGFGPRDVHAALGRLLLHCLPLFWSARCGRGALPRVLAFGGQRQVVSRMGRRVLLLPGFPRAWRRDGDDRIEPRAEILHGGGIVASNSCQRGPEQRSPQVATRLPGGVGKRFRPALLLARADKVAMPADQLRPLLLLENAETCAEIAPQRNGVAERGLPLHPGSGSANAACCARAIVAAGAAGAAAVSPRPNGRPNCVWAPVRWPRGGIRSWAPLALVGGAAVAPQGAEASAVRLPAVGFVVRPASRPKARSSFARAVVALSERGRFSRQLSPCLLQMGRSRRCKDARVDLAPCCSPSGAPDQLVIGSCALLCLRRWAGRARRQPRDRLDAFQHRCSRDAAAQQASPRATAHFANAWPSVHDLDSSNPSMGASHGLGAEAAQIDFAALMRAARDRYVEVFLYTDRPRARHRRCGEETIDSPQKEGGVLESAVARELVMRECREVMADPKHGSRMLLSMLGVELSPGARACVKQIDNGLKHFLAQHPDEFSVDGVKGCEHVTYHPAGRQPGNAASHRREPPREAVPLQLSQALGLLSPTPAPHAPLGWDGWDALPPSPLREVLGMLPPPPALDSAWEAPTREAPPPSSPRPACSPRPTDRQAVHPTPRSALLMPPTPSSLGVRYDHTPSRWNSPAHQDLAPWQPQQCDTLPPWPGAPPPPPEDCLQGLASGFAGDGGAAFAAMASAMSAPWPRGPSARTRRGPCRRQRFQAS
ncbi:unnamed protein product [Prorocentrum cordatum]|uniref:Uncharacterized protein n=1 Tax=Prorocentrum cordatum TaxID=2364126 RepID=A0ABN9UA71_9DINO|nr:unnamed protein product [Polarella glacialis]